MTQRRLGKINKANPQTTGSSRLTWVLFFQVVQTILLGLILISQFEWYPWKSLSGFVSGDSPRATYETPVKDMGAVEAVVTPAEIENPIKVEVLNGCGVAGIAARTADFLRKKGYDVRDFKNADRKNYTHTVIYVRSGARAQGEALAKTIALPLEMVEMKPDPDLVDIDVTLILGSDHRQYILPR